MGSELAIPDEKILALEEYATNALYDERERVALQYAESITVSEQDVDEALFERVRGCFGDYGRGRTHGRNRLGELLKQVQPGPADALSRALETEGPVTESVVDPEKEDYRANR